MLTKNAEYVMLTAGQPLADAYSGEENSPAGIATIPLIPGLTKVGWAGKNVLAQERKWSEHWIEPLTPRSVYHYRSQEEVLWLFPSAWTWRKARRRLFE